MSPADRDYPIPADPDDTRLSAGLTHELCDLLEQHGYPRPTKGADLLELQMFLFRFLYGGEQS